MIKTRLSTRLGAVLMLLAMLLTLFPIAVSAEDAPTEATFSSRKMLEEMDCAAMATSFMWPRMTV